MNQSLAGTVQTQFTIGVDSKVTSSAGAGLDDAVASCVVEVTSSRSRSERSDARPEVARMQQLLLVADLAWQLRWQGASVSAVLPAVANGAARCAGRRRSL